MNRSLLRAHRWAATVLVASAGFLTTLALEALTPGNPGPSTSLKPELQALSYFAGQWDCAGEFTASKKPIAAHLAFAADLGGSWLVLRWDDKEPGPFHALELWGFNKSSHRYDNFIYDGSGAVRRFGSPGWEGGSLTWNVEALPDHATFDERFVFERKSTTEFTVSWQVRKPQADWKTGDQVTCHPS